MGGPYVGNAATFVIETVVGLYILIVLLRLLLQWVRADFYNPISQFIVRATQPVLRPLRRVVPSLGGLDTASIVLLLGLQMIELFLVLSILGKPTGIVGLFVLALARLIGLLIYVFMFSILVLVVLSWIQPQSYNPAIGLLNSLSAPVMRPARQLVPPMAGLDLSPIVAMLVLGVALYLIVDPLTDAGARLLG